MFKKLAIASAILLTTSTIAVAATNGSPYLSAGVGVNHQIFKIDSGDAEATSGGTGALFNIAAGYSAIVAPNFVLAAEILANTTTGNVLAGKLDEDNISAKYNTKYTYGVSVLPGYQLSDSTLAYARVGVVKTRIDIDAKSPGVDTTEKNTVTGGQFGLGLQTKVASNVDVRGEYSYTAYRSFDVLSEKVNASSGQATVGIVYKFD